DRDEIVPVLPSGSAAATSVLTSATPGYSDVSDQLTTDRDASIAALEELGWTAGADGIREKDGQRLTLSVLLRANPARQAVLEVLQQQVAAVGIDLVIDVQDDATATESEVDGTYDY